MSVFNGNGNIRSDDCAVLVKDTVNSRISDYMLYSPYSQCTPAMEQVNAFSIENHTNNENNALPSCEIDTDSGLRVGDNTHLRGRQQLCVRPFAGTPFVGLGVMDTEAEDRLVQGDMRNSRKSCNPDIEKAYDAFVPMLPCIQQSVIAPVLPTLQRSGEPTRDFEHQEKFLKSFGYDFDGKVWKKKVCVQK